MSKHDDDYEVGYGKPPLKNRFKKGQSGNPKGRPRKQTQQIADALLNALQEKVSVVEKGERKMCKKVEVMMTQLANKAATGHLATIKFLLPILKDAGVFNPQQKILVEFIEGNRTMDWDELIQDAEEKKKKKE